MDLYQEFIKNIQAQDLFEKKDFLLLAVSGGKDSVALCELCFQAGFNFEIAHCNFKLRGEESDRDENFVRELSKQYGVDVCVKEFETEKYAQENKISIQVAARELRYAWFNDLLISARGEAATDNLRNCYLLTAHHADDNIETLLMNFFKGTGIKGLQGILPKQGKIIRPLLFAKREDIERFIKDNHLKFVEDSSNNSDKYTRNYFRHQLIPAVEKNFPQAKENLINNIERFREIDMLYQQSLQYHKKNLLEYKGNEIHIPILQLSKSKPLKTIIYEVIKDFGFTAHQTPEVMHLLGSDSGKYISSSTHKILKNRSWLIIAPLDTAESNHILIEKNDTKIDFKEGVLQLKASFNSEKRPVNSEGIALLDLKNLALPLLLRRWKEGDYFYPLGMQKKKKLSRFFIDRKIPLTQKEKIWVIESNKKIIWVIGQRIDERFKMTDKTRDSLEIRFTE